MNRDKFIDGYTKRSTIADAEITTALQLKLQSTEFLIQILRRTL